MPSSGVKAHTARGGQVKPLNTFQNEQAVTDRPLRSILTLQRDLHKVIEAALLWSHYALMAFSGTCQRRYSCALFVIRISVLLIQAGLTGKESEGGLEDNLRKCASNCYDGQQATAQCTALQALTWDGWETLYLLTRHQENENDDLAQGGPVVYSHRCTFSKFECRVQSWAGGGNLRGSAACF